MAKTHVHCHMKQDSAVDPRVWFFRTEATPGQALKYVSFAVQMLGKSFKMLPVTGKKLGGWHMWSGKK